MTALSPRGMKDRWRAVFSIISHLQVVLYFLFIGSVGSHA